MPRHLVALFTVMVLATYANADPEVPSREVIDETFTKMWSFAVAGDYDSWARFLAEDATFTNSSLPEPVVGRDAILELSRTWPQTDNIIEWKVIEGGRIAFAWHERLKLENGRWSDWYRGFSTYVFTSSGQVQSYEGMFNLPSIQAALQNSE